MDFYTCLSYSKSTFQLSYGEPILLLGSCFAENIGAKLEEAKFCVEMNPFGTLYNPASLAGAIRLLLQPRLFTEADLCYAGGMYHSFSHHSRFSAVTAEACLTKINERLRSSAEFLRKSHYLLITFGTSWIYRLKETGEVVANCHKLPASQFLRERLRVEELVEEWAVLLQSVWEVNPELRVLFTVSPIRHWKDGAHGNQLSKAVLLLAIDELVHRYPEQVAYFPSYEILMDELRDYRFYAEDMIHPSLQAVNYIWEQFVQHWITSESQQIMKEVEEIRRAIEHRPFNPDSEAYRQFILQTLLKIDRLNEKMTFFDFTKERKSLTSKLK